MVDPDQLSTRLLCKLDDLRTQMACTLARPDNPQIEQKFKETCSLYQNENYASDPIISQTYQELVDNYHQITSLYLIGELDGKANLFTYNTENEREEAKLIEISNRLDINGASIVQLPNGKLFCACKEYQSSFITFIINKNYELQMLPSENPFQCITTIYFRGNVYCFGEGGDSECLTYRFDLDRNLWFKLTPMPYHGPYCNSVIFNGNILISESSSKNLLRYSIDIDSFSIIPYGFGSDCKKVLINREERMYLIEWAENGFIYETAGDEYNWKQIAKSVNNQECDQIYWVYNKRGIYISTLNNDSSRDYYKFDLDNNTLIGISYYDRHIAIRGLGGKLEMIECYNQTFNLNPEIALSYNRGKFTINDLGRKLEAIEYCNEVIKLNPGNADAYYRKGNALCHLERHLKAIECFDEAIKIDPRNFNAYLNKGISLNALKRYTEAIDCFNECIKIDPYNFGGYCNKGDALYGLERYDEAIECYNEYIKINPRDTTVYRRKGHKLYKLNRYFEAIECHNELIKIDPRDVNAYKLKGGAFYKLARYLEAIDCYNEAIKIDPRDVMAYQHKGITFFDLERYLEAIECYDEIIKINPNNSYIYSYKGEAFYCLGRYLDAIECYDEAIKINPEIADFYKAKGGALYYLHRYLEAIECYGKAIKINPDIVDLYKLKGDAYARLDRYCEAIECYDEAIKVDPSYVFAYHRKGTVLFYNMDRKLEAIACYDEANKLCPNNPLNFFNRALAFNSLGQEVEALQDFYQGYYLAKESPTLSDANLYLSVINSNFSNEALKNDFIGLLQKFVQLQEIGIVLKEECNNLKDTKNQKIIKKIEEQEKAINEQHSQFLIKAASFFRPNNYNTAEEMQQSIYQINKEADEYIKRTISTFFWTQVISAIQKGTDQ